MAKKRLKYACQFCQKRFLTPHAKWGHLPHCPKHNVSLEPATQPGAEPRPSTPGDFHRPGPDSQEMKLLLLDTGEMIIQRRSDAEHHAWWADFLDRTVSSQVKEDTTPQEWARIAQDLGDVERDFDQMIGPLRLNRTLLFNSYHKMLAVQGAWLEYQARDFSRNGELTPEGAEVLREEEALFVELILNIKRMLVAAR